MNRRHFLKQAMAATAVGAVVPKTVSATTRSYQSPTISIEMMELERGVTDLHITEHGDADYVIVEAFYWTTIQGQRAILHKEATTPLAKGHTFGASVPLPVDSIVFLRVRELQVLKQSEFGDVPKK